MCLKSDHKNLLLILYIDLGKIFAPIQHCNLLRFQFLVFHFMFYVIVFYQLFYCSPTFFAHCQRDIFLQSAFSILYHLSSTRRFYATRLGIDVWPSAHCGLHRNLPHLIWMPCANFPKWFQLFKLSILKYAAV